MPGGTGDFASFVPAIRSVFLRWERLRVLYNLALVAVVLFPTGGSFELPEIRQLPELAIGAVLANLCYLAGPIVEAYLTWLGLRTRWVTAALFSGGVLVSVPLVYMFGFAYVLMNS